MAQAAPRKNPYIIGRPIDEPTLFFGRQNLFNFLEKNLKQNVKISVLHGQRRIGKSSIIRNIPKLIKSDNFVFIRFDLEYYSSENIGEILLALAQEILEQLDLDKGKIKLPKIKDLEKDIYVFYSKFIVLVFQEIKGKNIVLLFDEFDSLIADYHKSDIDDFFTYLASIVEVENRLFLIICAGRQNEDRQNTFDVFPNISYYEIGFLSQDSTEKLIKEPAKDILEYDTEAINKIFELSAGHPYFIQTICFAIFVIARELGKWQVTVKDVDKVIDKAIEYAEAGLAWFWDGLTITEKMVFSAVAEFQDLAIEKKQMLPATPFKLLEEMYGVPIRPSIQKASLELVKSNFLNKSENKVIIELVRLWLLQRHPLSQEIKYLQKFNDDKQNNFNSKNISTSNLEHKDINNSYVHDSALAVPMTLSLERLRHERRTLSNNQNLCDEESKHLDKVAQAYITPQRKLIFNKIFSNISKNSCLPILTIAALIAPIVTIFAVKNLSQACSPREKSFIGIFCLENLSHNISHGESTFFKIKSNSNIDKGNQAFKQGNYQKSREYFETVLTANSKHLDNPSDQEILPEVLIYYNNARALKKGNPLTLAVVLPIDNKANIGQEILRGVAQAQNEFNEKGGSNNRLLEIYIANDTGEPETAKKVAAELTKKNSILGIIGHFSSNTTESALEEYKKAEIPVIAPKSSDFSVQSDILFRSLPSDAAASKKLAEYAQKLNVKNIVIFSNHNSSYSKSIRKEFTTIFEAMGGNVVYEPNIDLKKSSFNAKDEVYKSVFEYEAEAALLIMDTQNTDIALGIAEANYELINDTNNTDKKRLKLLGNDTLYSERIIGTEPKIVEGLTIAVPWFSESTKSKEFAKKAEKLKGNISWRTAISFDATQAFIEALLESKNPTRSTVIKNLENVNLSASETSGDIFKFNSERERIIEPVLVRVENGRFITVGNSK